MSDFEKWWATVPCEYTDVVNEDVARAAYEAGCKAILNTIIDMATVNWTFAEADEDDAKIMIHKLMCQAQDQAVDPAISKEAQALIERGRIAGLEEAVRTIELEKEKIIHSPMFIGLGDYKREDQCAAITAAIRERIK